jgi:hypothetical protein
MFSHARMGLFQYTIKMTFEVLCTGHANNGEWLWLGIWFQPPSFPWSIKVDSDSSLQPLFA